MDIRLLMEHDVEEFVRLRHEALRHEPYAFGRAPEVPLPWPSESVAAHLRNVPEGDFIVGAFVGQKRVGQAGFFRHTGRKVQHKGRIWGVYVSAKARGQGRARAMMTQIVECVRAYSGLDVHFHVANPSA